MRYRARVPILLALALLLAPPFPAGAAEWERLALVVGFAGDASAGAMAEALEEMGFETHLLLDPDRETLEIGIRRFAGRLPEKGVGFFYFAGRVEYAEGHSFLVPAGVEIGEAEDLRYRAVDLGFLLSKLEGRESALNLVVLDACREEPLVPPDRESPVLLLSELVPELADSGRTFVAEAVRPCGERGGEEVAPFTRELIDALDRYGLTLDQIFRGAREAARSAGETRVRTSAWDPIRDFPLPPPPKTTGPRGMAGNDLAAHTFDLPEFPWPPPRPTTRYESRDLVPAGAATLGALAAHLEQALGRKGYDERAYFAAPGGFAVVTRMERIGADGVPMPASERWIGELRRRSFSLADYARVLFFGETGHFRVLVFLVTSAPVPLDGEAPAPRDLEGGVNRLPGEIAAAELTPEHRVSLLVYEFEQHESRDELAFAESPRLSGRDHLAASGLLALLVPGT